jgi:hypothetical protein
MKKYLITIVAIIYTQIIFAQLPALRIVDGALRTVESGMLLVPPKDKYKKIIDSLDKNIKKSPNDTTSLFYRALLYYSYNQKIAEPAQSTKGTLEKLTIAKDMIEKAIAEKMNDKNAKILRAQIYAELCYRFSGDEKWMFDASEIVRRRKLFENYKAITNRYYTNLILFYPDSEPIYAKKKIEYIYPIK